MCVDVEGMDRLSPTSSTSPDPVEIETSREPAGLPSALLEPQGTLLDEEHQDLTDGGTVDISLLTEHLVKTKLGENVFPNMKVFTNFYLFSILVLEQ